MKKRVLAMLLALALAAALLPVAALAAISVVSTYVQLNAAITSATDVTNTEIVLIDDIKGSITIPAGKTITLNLGGCTLTNTAGQHTITVEKGATLIIEGTGTVDNVSHAKAALYNKGTVTINSGTFTRSQEVQITGANPTNTNSWYLVENGGKLIINGGTFYTGRLDALGNQSSLIRNGASDENGTPNTVTAKGTLTITGGIFTTAANVIKNEITADDGTPSKLTISGGTFTMDNSKIQWYGGNSIVQNYGTAEIIGGTFRALGNGESARDLNLYRQGVLSNGSFAQTTVGGSASFEMEGDKNKLVRAIEGGKATINGGSYTLDNPASSTNKLLVAEGDGSEANDLQVSAGTFSDEVEKQYLAATTPYATLNNTTYYVGETNVQAAAASAPSGSTVTVLQGNVNLSAQEGVTVVNDVNNATGTVTVGGRRLSPGASYTVPYPPATHDDLLITRLPDGSNQPVQVVVTLDRLLSGPYGGYQFDHGVATLSIASGQTLYIHQLPVGTNYTITLLDGTVVSGSALTGTILPGVDAMASFTALPGVTPDLPGGEIVEGEEEIVEPGEEEGDLAEGTEETPPEESEEIPEEGLEELPEEGEDLPEEPVDVPQTGDAAPAAGLAILLGLAVCALALKKVRAK